MARRAAKGPRLRLWVQACTAALSNGYLRGFTSGKIYAGPSKLICLPGLNCYSCPGALGACPIGALQAVLGARQFAFSFYLLGFFLVVGGLTGRFVCGWLCPFGLIQELLHKIPFKKKLRRLPGERWLGSLRYLVLVVFVILLPLTVVDLLGRGSPWFCSYICPAGTLTAGWPMLIANPSLRDAVGWLFGWKNLVLLTILVGCVVVYRPFCRYLCPLGAIYGLLNPVSLWRIEKDEARCTSCGGCQKVCKLDIAVEKTPNSPACIRCGACVRACPHGALSSGFAGRQKKRNRGVQT